MTYILGIMAFLFSISMYSKACAGRNRIVMLIYFILIYNLSIKFIIGSFRLPSLLNYLSDFAMFWLILEDIAKIRPNKQVGKAINIAVILLLIWALISFVVNIYSPFLFLWGLRNNIRFFIYAILAIKYLEKRDIKNIMVLLTYYFFFNVLVVTYQAFGSDYSVGANGDFISGLFSNGVERGGNGALNWLSCILCTYWVVAYFNNQSSAKLPLLITGLSLYIAAISEVKIFFVQIIIIAVAAISLGRKSFKPILFIIIGALGFSISLRAMYFLFPHFADFFTYNTILDYMTRESGYSTMSEIGVNRLTAISFVFDHYLLDSWSRIFGIGIGNADYSSFSIVTSSFYRANSRSGYTFFQTSFIVIEMGLVGLVLYLNVFFAYLKNAVTIPSKNESEKTICQTVIILFLLCIIAFVNGSTLRIDTSAYMVNLIMVLPCILKKNDMTNIDDYKLKKRRRLRWKR